MVGVNLQIGVGPNRGFVAESEKRSEFFVRTHGDQTSAAKSNPMAKHCYLRLGERHFAEYDHVVREQHKVRNMCYVYGVEVSKPFGAQYLRVILRELISRCGNDENGTRGRKRGYDE